jgi:hypothetical protein
VVGARPAAPEQDDHEQAPDVLVGEQEIRRRGQRDQVREQREGRDEPRREPKEQQEAGPDEEQPRLNRHDGTEVVSRKAGADQGHPEGDPEEPRQQVPIGVKRRAQRCAVPGEGSHPEVPGDGEENGEGTPSEYRGVHRLREG